MDIRNKLITQFAGERPHYIDFCAKMGSPLRDLIRHEALSCHTITSRVKEADSFSGKLERKDKYQALEEVTDLAGVRIITYYDDEVDAIAALIEREFLVDHDNTIDKRKAHDPDRFGYMSLHYVVQFSPERCKLGEYSQFNGMKAEIQIRSILQHTWAEIEHDLGYKSRVAIPRHIQRDFFRLAGLLELADKEFMGIRDSLKDYRESVREDIAAKSDEVLIDNISLRAYIDGNERLRTLNRKIANCFDQTLEPQDNLSRMVDELQWVYLYSIRDIDEALEENYGLCLYLAKNFITKTDRKFRDIIGLFYLCYAILVKEEDADRIKEYWNDNKIISADDLQRAQELIDIYKQYQEETHASVT